MVPGVFSGWYLAGNGWYLNLWEDPQNHTKFGTTLLLKYERKNRLVPAWYRVGTGLVPGWYRVGLGLVVVE